MRSFLLLFTVVLVACSAPRGVARPRTSPPVTSGATAESASSVDLDYVVRRAPRPDGTSALVVEATFPGLGTGRTELLLPDAWAGEKELYRDIAALDATSPGAHIEPSADPSRRVVVHPPGAMVSIRYELPQAPERASIDEHRAYRVLVQAAYVHAIGFGLWVTPALDGQAPRTIRIRWADFPAGTVIANSFGAGLSDQRFSETLDRFRHAVFVAGDFRLHEATIRGKKVSVALRGKWGFEDAALVDLVARVVDVERAFFEDDDFERFLVTLIPTGEGCCSYGGTGLTDSFATFVTSDLPIERRMIHLLSHELFHTWNGRRIGRQHPEELVYWFSEGFTDYYAELLSFRAGLLSFDAYVDAMNATLRQYHLSPARNAPNEAVLKDFWNDRAIERLPYERGRLLALLWDDRIRTRKEGASLDDVMRDLFRAARDTGAVVSADTIDRLVRAYVPDGVAADIARYVDRGETVPAPPGALGPCVRLASVPIGPFELGFDEKVTDEEGEVVGVVRGSAAERAGLRDGMKLRRSKWSMDPTRPAVLTVREGDRDRTIEYLPQGAPVLVPQYRLDEKAYAASPATCTEPLLAR
jgi:predicted metalloprotease with PDZ domain